MDDGDGVRLAGDLAGSLEARERAAEGVVDPGQGTVERVVLEYAEDQQRRIDFQRIAVLDSDFQHLAYPSFEYTVSEMRIALASLAVALVFSACGVQGAAPRAAALGAEFDGARAFAHLEAQVAFGPRVPGSDRHAAARQFLIDTLGAWVDELITHDFEHPSPSGMLAMTNIIGVINPQASRRVLLAAHWDTRPTADMEPDVSLRSRPIDGANDGASGVAVLLEVTRLLAESPPAVGVVIALLDGEDYGPDTEMMFLGSRVVVDALPEPKPEFGILLDMVGDADLELPYEPNSLRLAPEVVERVWSTAERLGETAFTRRMGPTILDDHVFLSRAGVPTIDVIDFSYPYWHTVEDTVDKTSAESLWRVGRVILEVVRGL